MKTEIFKNYQEFLGREDKELNGVSEQFAIENPNYEKDNETNNGCWNCIDCEGCEGCIDGQGLTDKVRCIQENKDRIDPSLAALGAISTIVWIAAIIALAIILSLY